MSEIDAYFAGLIDGEGSLLITKRGPSSPNGLRAVIKVKMTDKSVIDALAETYGGNITECPAEKEHWKTQWRWMVQDKSAKETLPKLYPYLRVKREAADRMIEYFKTARGRGRPRKVIPVL